MLELYMWTTDNGYKSRQAMEESGLPHTLKFLTRVEPLIDHPLDIQRASPIAALASSEA